MKYVIHYLNLYSIKYSVFYSTEYILYKIKKTCNLINLMLYNQSIKFI